MFVEMSTEDVEYFATCGTKDFRTVSVSVACKSALKRKENKVELIYDVKWLREKIAFAEGKVIQFRDDNLTINWFIDLPARPNWESTGMTFRIKPEPKPDIVMCAQIILANGMRFEQHNGKDNNVKITFDGETCELKDMEIIK